MPKMFISRMPCLTGSEKSYTLAFEATILLRRCRGMHGLTSLKHTRLTSRLSRAPAVTQLKTRVSALAAGQVVGRRARRGFVNHSTAGERRFLYSGPAPTPLTLCQPH